MACTSPSSYEIAGRYGLGLLSFTAGVTTGLAGLVATYRDAIRRAEPVGAFVHEATASFCTMHCRDDDRLARERGGASALMHLGFMEQYYGRIFESRGYREFHELDPAAAEAGSFSGALLKAGVDGLVSSGTICVGDPGRCREIVAMYRDAGFENYLALIQYGTLSAEETLASLRLFAEKVMPAFA
jgi:alkanesulfonate monooxygenase SsuD/methylene tetrahydromethanopterin reductase-like flavin-dependent oxidoreductase (luciferase family)